MEWLQAKIIEHQQVRAEIGLEAPLKGAIGAAAIERLEQLCGRGEEGIEPLSARFMD